MRAILERARNSGGLIQCYLPSKGDLTRAAYVTLVTRVTAETLVATEGVARDPAVRLAPLISARPHPAVLDCERVRLQAGFLHHVRRDPAVQEVHEPTSLGDCDRLQGLCQAVPACPGLDADRPWQRCGGQISRSVAG